MTSSTASLNAISARFSSGSRRTLLGTLLIRHRSARSAPDTAHDSLYEAYPLSQKRPLRAFHLNCRTDLSNQVRISDILAVGVLWKKCTRESRLFGAIRRCNDVKLHEVSILPNLNDFVLPKADDPKDLGQSPQFGNGFRIDSRNLLISARMAVRRWRSAATSRCRPSRWHVA